jgi:periplasmic protein TonB
VNEFALQSLPHSRPTLALVVVVHVVAALLIVQMFEARRYIEPVPLMVSLLPAVQRAEPAPKPPEPLREAKRERVPAPVVEPKPIPEPVTERAPEPEAIPEPVPVEVRHEPKPVEHVVVREPAPAPIPEPPVQKISEPMPEKALTPVPVSAPEPPPRAITEVPVPPSPQAPPSPPAPAIVAAPEPKPITVAIPPRQSVDEPEEVTMTSQMLTAIYLRNPKPSYPNLSRRLSEQGTVLLRVFVTVAGDAVTVELKQSSGFPRLDKAAQEAVQAWKFVPAKRGEQSVAAWVLVPIKFSLKG